MILTVAELNFAGRLFGSWSSAYKMSLDGTDCMNNESSLLCPKWHSQKFKSAAVRYEVGVSVEGSSILWAQGLFPQGSLAI